MGWESLFWLVFRRSSNAIALIDDRRRFVEVNDPALALLGRSRGETLGISIADSVKPSERPKSAQEWQAFLRSGECSDTRVLIRANGSEVEVDFAARLASIGDRQLAIYVMLPRSESRPSSTLGRDHEESLTNREREVVTLIALGGDTSEIAERLHISPETVRTHVRNAMTKLGARTRAQLVAIALSTDRTILAAHLGE
jgi:PAS domain S-box-containing protein